MPRLPLAGVALKVQLQVHAFSHGSFEALRCRWQGSKASRQRRHGFLQPASVNSQSRRLSRSLFLRKGLRPQSCKLSVQLSLATYNPGYFHCTPAHSQSHTPEPPAPTQPPIEKHFPKEKARSKFAPKPLTVSISLKVQTPKPLNQTGPAMATKAL